MNTHAQRQRRIRVARAAEAESASDQVAVLADLLCGHAQMLIEDARRIRASAHRNRVATRLLSGSMTGSSAPTITEAVAS